MPGLAARFVDSMEDVPRGLWDALAAANGADLMRWGLLSAFESSGSMRPETGWTPRHFLLERGDRLVACAPLYLKTHSWGEFVFDFEWAEVAQSNGIRWYPKLVGMVPATPVPAWRLLIDPAEDERQALEIFLDSLMGLARSEKLGGVHLLWVDPRFAPLGPALGARGWAPWIHQGFLWENRDWENFGAMLESFSKNMRRNVGRDRERIARAGLVSEIVEGSAAPAGLHDLMERVYLRTNDRFGPWAARFLEPGFFAELARRWPEGMLYSVARYKDEDPVAAALLFRGERRLYGRYWGTLEDADGLHFEACYYRPMEWAIESGFEAIDPGMGGEHKTRRGFRALPAFSYHFPLDPRLLRTMAQVMPRINEGTLAGIEEINRDLPFKRGTGVAPGGFAEERPGEDKKSPGP
jgi:predicted N-acyltransferase